MIDPLIEKLLVRGLIEPGVDHRKAILENEDVLSGAAGLWRGSKHILQAVLQARIDAIEHELVTEATPYEVLTLRQAMIEVAFIFDDFEAYAREFERRKKDGGDSSSTGEGDMPPAVGALPPDNAVDNGNESSM